MVREIRKGDEAHRHSAGWEKGDLLCDLLSHTAHVDVSTVTPRSPQGVVSQGVHRAVPSAPLQQQPAPLHHHVGSVADYISYSYVNLNEIKQPIIRSKDTLQIRLAGWSEAIHPTRTPSVEQLMLLNGCPFTVHKKKDRGFSTVKQMTVVVITHYSSSN